MSEMYDEDQPWHLTQEPEGQPSYEELEAENNLLKTSGIIEVAVRNPRVMEYMQHWEGRAEAAEAKLAKAVARLKKECGFDVHCYWDADDREIGHFDICDILDAYDFGTVAEIEHVAVIAATFEAQLPPADDSETDDLFEVCEHTREAAEVKVAAEVSRRATLKELKEQNDDH